MFIIPLYSYELSKETSNNSLFNNIFLIVSLFDKESTPFNLMIFFKSIYWIKKVLTKHFLNVNYIFF